EARQWPQRRRFTIGHELGHWVMHRSGQESLFCRHQTVRDEAPGQLAIDVNVLPERRIGGAARSPAEPIAEIPLTEAEANAFSAALLMPRDLFKAEYVRCGGDIATLQGRFDCSEKASRRRVETVFGAL